MDVVRRERRRAFVSSLVAALGVLGISLFAWTGEETEEAWLLALPVLALVVIASVLTAIFVARLQRAAGPGVFTEAAGFGGLATRLSRMERLRVGMDLRRGSPEEALRNLLAWAPNLLREEVDRLAAELVALPGARHEIMRLQRRRARTPPELVVGGVLVAVNVAILLFLVLRGSPAGIVLGALNFFLVSAVMLPATATMVAGQFRAWGEMVARLQAKARGASFPAAGRIRT